MKITKNPKFLFYFILVLIFIGNLFQGYYTELLDDEAYYWVWSKHLSWGYFDHPPMVALWIKISSIFFNGTLGVRFFSAFMFSFTLIYLWKIIANKDNWHYVWLFYLLVFSVFLFNFYGFITVPDTPLYFFTAAFLYYYKRFLEENTWKFSLLMGLSMALMLYSKYHGILVILFVLFSNLSLLKNRKFWIASIFGALLFLPHLWWQFQNGFPSILYQMHRSKKLYRIDFTLLYFVNQLIIVGLTFPILYYSFFKKKITTKFEKGLHYILIGFIVFFFFSTFKTSTQPQWTGIILIPLLIESFDFLIHHKKLRTWLIYLAAANFIFIIAARIILADTDINILHLETHGNTVWTKELKKATKGKPIVFIDSFQDASKYAFYTNNLSYSYNTLYYRPNQYDLGGFENKIQGKNVYVVSKYLKSGKELFTKRGKKYYGYPINNFTIYQKLKCIIPKENLLLKKGKVEKIDFILKNPYNENIKLKNIHFYGVFQAKKQKIDFIIPLTHLVITAKNEETINKIIKKKSNYKVSSEIKVPPNLKDSKTFRIGITFYNLPVGYQGNIVTLK